MGVYCLELSVCFVGNTTGLRWFDGGGLLPTAGLKTLIVINQIHTLILNDPDNTLDPRCGHILLSNVMKNVQAFKLIFESSSVKRK